MTNYQINEMNAEVAQQFGKLIAERDAFKVELIKCRTQLAEVIDLTPDEKLTLKQLLDERDALKAKLAASERERTALQKAHDLLNKGFESATEQMHNLKQTVRSLEHEAAALRHGPTPQEWEAVKAARLKAEAASVVVRGILAEIISIAERCSPDACFLPITIVGLAKAAITSDAGQNVTDFIAAARRRGG